MRTTMPQVICQKLESLDDPVARDPATHDHSASFLGRNTNQCPTHGNPMTILHARGTHVQNMVLVIPPWAGGWEKITSASEMTHVHP